MTSSKSSKPHTVVTSYKNFKFKSFRIFQIEAWRPCFFMGLEQLYGFIGGQVMTGQIPSHYSGFAIITGIGNNTGQ